MITFTDADYCIMSAALRYIEEHPETWVDVEAKVNKMLGGDKQIYPLSENMLDGVNQQLWQHHDYQKLNKETK
jgi:hypothetical protein